MNTQTKAVKRTFVSLKLPVSVPALLQTTKVILLAVTHNPSFPAPDPSLATLQAALLALEEAETAVRSGSRGAAVSRDEKRRELGTLLRQVGAYVQKVADGDPSTAEAVIQSGGVSARKLAIRQKQRFTVRQGAASAELRGVGLCHNAATVTPAHAIRPGTKPVTWARGGDFHEKQPCIG